MFMTIKIIFDDDDMIQVQIIYDFKKASRPIVMGDPPEIQLVPECRNCTSVKDNLRLILLII